MIGATFEKLQQSIFERNERILHSAETAGERARARFGAFVRQRMKKNTRARKKVSAPGQNPSGHTMKIYDNIVFVTEPKNVIIGPLLLNAMHSKTTLEALEVGGPSLLFKKARGRQPAQTIPIHVEARPFAKPAFDEEVKKSPELWKDAMK